jgi:hypothetical protein
LFYSNLVGIKCAVIEKNVEFTRHPRAHFINNRTMEVCTLTSPFWLVCVVWALLSQMTGIFRSSASWMVWPGTLRGPSHQ